MFDQIPHKTIPFDPVSGPHTDPQSQRGRSQRLDHQHRRITQRRILQQE